jgi:hypothetical protein
VLQKAAASADDREHGVRVAVPGADEFLDRDPRVGEESRVVRVEIVRSHADPVHELFGRCR